MVECNKFKGANGSIKQINPSTSRSDQHETSPYNILTLSSKQVMRIFKLIRWKLLT